jgi:hypothetical protein
MSRAPRDPRYCNEFPHDPKTGQPRCRCNWCWNGLVDDKNQLVREMYRVLEQVRQLEAAKRVSPEAMQMEVTI